MITIKLIGGLGNQMFQYCYGRKISLLKKEKLALDTTFLNSRLKRKNFTLRNYELDVFNIEAKVTTLSNLSIFINDYLFLIQMFKNKISFFLNKDSVLDEHIHKTNLEKKVLSNRTNTYISGLFDQEKHARSIDTIIRRDFSLKKPLNENNNMVLEKIKGTNSVSLHIRRGDLVHLGYTISESEYYLRAVNYVNDMIPEPFYYIFSDDPVWVKNNLRLGNASYIVSINFKEDSHLDMYLMSQCKHNIIANSTFSWWGAWLNENQNKIVIAPKAYSDEHPGMMPKEWIIL
jgi:hypothetical protein